VTHEIFRLGGIADKIATWPEGMNMSVTTEQIQNALRELIDPVTEQNYVESKSAKNIIVDGAKVSLEIALGYPAKSVIETVRKQVVELLPGCERIRSSIHRL
jgi:ATP-binding protein involved in chromosome partitioning